MLADMRLGTSGAPVLQLKYGGPDKPELLIAIGIHFGFANGQNVASVIGSAGNAIKDHVSALEAKEMAGPRRTGYASPSHSGIIPAKRWRH